MDIKRRKPEEEHRTRQIIVKVTESEFEQIEVHSQSTGITKSTLGRKAILKEVADEDRKATNS